MALNEPTFAAAFADLRAAGTEVAEARASGDPERHARALAALTAAGEQVEALGRMAEAEGAGHA